MGIDYDGGLSTQYYVSVMVPPMSLHRLFIGSKIVSSSFYHELTV